MWRRRHIPLTKRFFAEHINRSVGSACHNALYSAYDGTKAQKAAFRRLPKLLFIDMFVGETSDNVKKVINEDGKRY